MGTGLGAGKEAGRREIALGRRNSWTRAGSRTTGFTGYIPKHVLRLVGCGDHDESRERSNRVNIALGEQS
jgi:hypothetical protein